MTFLRYLTFLPLLVFATLSLSAQGKILLMKQWHLGSGMDTTGMVNPAEKIKPFRNQKTIYVYLRNRITKGKIAAVVGEGHSGEITPDFKKSFNGWSYQKLKAQKESENYADIMTHIPLKLEVKLTDQVKTVGGDNEELVALHQQVFGHLKRYSNLYIKLKQTKGRDPKTFGLYKQKLLADVPRNPANIDALKFARKKALGAINLEKKILTKRNEFFLAKLLDLKEEFLEKDVALVIGARHVPNLVERLKKRDIKFEVVEFPGLPKEGKRLIPKLKGILKT